MKPWALSIKSRQDNPRESLANKVLGVRKHPKLGYLTPTITSRTNAAMVERSWSFLDYGPKFTYQEFARVSTRLAGLAVHIGFAIGAILLAFPPIRWFARKVLTQPGDGPTRESTLKDQAEYYAVGVADTTPPRTAVASMKWKGSMVSDPMAYSYG